METPRIPLGTEAAGTEPTRSEHVTPLMGDGAAIRTVRNVNVASMTVHLPPAGTATGDAVVVLPGGGWHLLAVEHEGDDIAAALSARGIAAFVLEYRLMPTPLDDAEAQAHLYRVLGSPGGMRAAIAEYEALPLADGRRAVELVRERAAEWGVAADRVGMMGFSAGGYLTVQLALAGVPDFALSIYGAVLEPVKAPADAPPLFVAAAADDELGKPIVDGAIDLFNGWRDAGRPVELHLYSGGSHGFGSHATGTTSDAWLDQAVSWIEVHRGA